MDKEIILVDTSVFIDYFRKQNKEKTLLVDLSKKYTIAVSVITRFELLVGVKDKKQRNFWEILFSDIIVFPIADKEAERSALIMQYLRQSNKMIGLPDIFIAATALENSMTIATLNHKDFARVPDLKLLNQPPQSQSEPTAKRASKR